MQISFTLHRLNALHPDRDVRMSAEASGRGSDSSRRMRTRQQEIAGNLKRGHSLRARHGREMVQKPFEGVACGQVVEQITPRCTPTAAM